MNDFEQLQQLEDDAAHILAVRKIVASYVSIGKIQFKSLVAKHQAFILKALPIPYLFFYKGDEYLIDDEFMRVNAFKNKLVIEKQTSNTLIPYGTTYHAGTEHMIDSAPIRIITELIECIISDEQEMKDLKQFMVNALRDLPRLSALVTILPQQFWGSWMSPRQVVEGRNYADHPDVMRFKAEQDSIIQGIKRALLMRGITNTSNR